MRSIGPIIAVRRPVNLTLDAGLLAELDGLTPDLSATVERLLSDWVAQETARRRVADAPLERVLDAVNEHHAKHGFLSDFCPNF